MDVHSSAGIEEGEVIVNAHVGRKEDVHWMQAISGSDMLQHCSKSPSCHAGVLQYSSDMRQIE